MLIGAFCFLFILKTSYKNRYKGIQNYILYTGTLFMTALLVFYIQFLFSGKWWVFFDVQKLWQRELRIPTLPFTTISGKDILWLDSAALLTCEIAVLTCIMMFYQRIREQKSLNIAPSFLLSCAYLAIAGCLATFYSGIHNANEGTSIYSINRFVFATPFFIVALDFILNKNHTTRKRNIIILTVLMLFTWIITGVFNTHNPFYFFSLTVYVFAYVLLLKNSGLIYYTLLLINLLLQVFLFNAFINGHWIG